jgi:hypothetical protein
MTDSMTSGWLCPDTSAVILTVDHRKVESREKVVKHFSRLSCAP